MSSKENLAALQRTASKEQLNFEGNPVDQDMQEQDLYQEMLDQVEDDLQNDKLTSISQKLPSHIPTNISGRTYISELQKQLQEEK